MEKDHIGNISCRSDLIVKENSSEESTHEDPNRDNNVTIFHTKPNKVTILLRELSLVSANNNHDTLTKVEETLIELSRCCNKMFDVKCNQHRDTIIQQKGQRTIVKAMTQYMYVSSDIQFAGCRALTSSICGMDDTVKRCVAEEDGANAYNIVMAALHQYPDELYLQMGGCQFLANITTIIHTLDDSNVHKTNNSSNCRFDDSIQTVLNVMQRFSGSIETQRIGCLFFVNISRYG
jgi:hypothetical protein